MMIKIYILSKVMIYLYDEVMMDPILNLGQPNTLRIMSRNHSMLPPFMQPHPSEEEQLEQFNFLINKMASDARNNFFRFRLFNQDHQSRETSAIIDEYLYMQDHQRIQDEIKYNLAKDAILKNVFH
jgi:hypothetical protein